jgi:nucleolar protein 56
MNTRTNVILLELGIVILDDEGKLINSVKFEDPAQAHHSLSKGDRGPITGILSDLSRFEQMKVNHPLLLKVLSQPGLRLELASQSEQDLITREKLNLLTKYEFCKSRSEAIEVLQKFATDYSSIRLKESSESLDQHAIQAVNALDEIDEVINTIGTRMREWYGLHFPELDNLLQNVNTYANIVKTAGSRENIEKDVLVNQELQESKIQLIIQMAIKSRGGDISPETTGILQKLAEEVLTLSKLRTSLSETIEDIMRKIAPNLNNMITAVIAARLISRAGSLKKLAQLPASTIQILGAEKALFRALKTGARPPKHGLLFQHPAVHAAPKWQRGKIARALASKIAIASRVDFYRHSLMDADIMTRLNRRIQDIQNSSPRETSQNETRGRTFRDYKKEQYRWKGNKDKWSKKRAGNRKRSDRFGKRKRV